MPIYCFLDIGSNSVRCLLVEAGEGELRVLDDVSRITRLARGLGQAGEAGTPGSVALLPEAVEATISAVKEMQQKARSAGAKDFHAVATWALRTAEGGAVDADCFLSRLQEETGVRAKVLSSEEECRLGFLGATSSLALEGGFTLIGCHPEGPCVVLDIGGGTLNLTWGMAAGSGGRRELKGWISLPLGARAMSEAFFRHDPPLDEEVEALCGWVRRRLGGRLGKVPRGVCGVGCGGVFTSLAAFLQCRGEACLARSSARSFEYDRDLVHGYVLSTEGLERVARELAGMTVAQRAALPGIGEERADIIAAGAVVGGQVAALLGLAEMVVSDKGLLWGLALGVLG